MVDRPFASLEVPGALPRPPLSGDHVRRARLRPVGPSYGTVRLQLPGVRRRRARRARCRRRPTGPCSPDSRWAPCGASLLAADEPERVLGVVCFGPALGLAPMPAEREVHPFNERLSTTEGWAKYNRYHWLEGGYPDFLEFFFHQFFPEPHSTKQIEDFVELGPGDRPVNARHDRRRPLCSPTRDGAGALRTNHSSGARDPRRPGRDGAPRRRRKRWPRSPEGNSSPSPVAVTVSRPATRWSSTTSSSGSSTGSADEGSRPRSRRLRRARRRQGRVRGLRRGGAQPAPRPTGADHPLEGLQGHRPEPRPSPPCRHRRRPGHRPVRPADNDRAASASGERRRHRRRARCDRSRSGRAARPLPRQLVGRRRHLDAPRPGARARRHFARRPLPRGGQAALGRGGEPVGGDHRRADRVGVVQPPRDSARPAPLGGVLLRRAARRTALDEAVRGRGVVGDGVDRRDPRRQRRGPGSRPTHRAWRSSSSAATSRFRCS